MTKNNEYLKQVMEILQEKMALNNIKNTDKRKFMIKKTVVEEWVAEKVASKISLKRLYT